MIDLLKRFRPAPLCDSICVWIAKKYLTPFFIRKRVKPNTITLYMIIVGGISGIFFIYPSMWTKLLCSLLYLLWYSLDCSDGQVARATSNCSPEGKQLDYIAHIVAHPLFIIGLLVTILSFYQYCNLFYIITLTLLLLSSEMSNRLVIAMASYNEKKQNYIEKKDNPIKKIYNFINCQIGFMPNLLLFFPVIIFCDLYFDLYYFEYLFYIWGLYYIIFVSKELFFYTLSIYK